ncbi:dTDP-4-dehydrorhamnose reductase family protein [Paenibacillus sp. S-38]|uniref:dTDP-4-dehydrorhamnose reductase family protein n=1 Tax=Paenibacillus sp. S-38 TaxID=3416710 RepID=UPI003CFB9F00
MKVLILGGRGMAGHMIKAYLQSLGTDEVWSTQREPEQGPGEILLDVTDEQRTWEVLQSLRPELVVNAAGLLNRDAERRLEESIRVNGLLPHRLAEYGDRLNFRLIHISTDCVFSGSRGGYRESDPADGVTVYAKTKSLGEIAGHPRHLTIRTSIIGPELKPEGIGLFHWFMNQSGDIPGYRHVYWNGVTTLELARAVRWAAERPVAGLMHLAVPQKISKHDLLLLMQRTFRRDGVKVEPYDAYRSDKSLVNTRTDAAYLPSDYAVMLSELRDWMKDRPIYRRYQK